MRIRTCLAEPSAAAWQQAKATSTACPATPTTPDASANAPPPASMRVVIVLPTGTDGAGTGSTVKFPILDVSGSPSFERKTASSEVTDLRITSSCEPPERAATAYIGA